jgi:hypothetical protein
MLNKPPPSPEWSSESVRLQLKAKSSSRGGAAAQVFFDKSVPADKLAEAAQTAIRQVASRTGRRRRVRIGKISPLANAVSVRGDPDLIADLMGLDEVQSVLPSEIDDVYPKPVRRRPVK